MPRIRIKASGDAGAKRGKKALAGATKEALFASARDWHGHTLPKHSTVAGGRTYGYLNRSAKYAKRKGKLKGHQMPLVFSGVSRERALTAPEITGTSKAVKVSVHANALNFLAKQRMGYVELMKLTPDEAHDIEETFAGVLNERMTAATSRADSATPATTSARRSP